MEFLKKSRAFLFLVATFFFWGSVYVGGKLISGDVPAPLLGCLRCFVAVFPLMLMARRHFGIKIDRADWKYFIAVGVLGYFMTIFLIQMGISLTGASMAALVNSVTPVGVTIFAAIHLKEKITPTKILCLALALAGTFIITTGAAGQGEIMGILAVLVAVVSWSLASVYMRQLTAKYPPILVTAYGMAISLIFHIPSGVISAIQAGGTGLSMNNILVVLYLGLIGSGLAQYTWTASLSQLPASTCSLFYPLQPMFSALLGMLILHETFAPSFLVGMVLISADVILSTLETRKLSQAEVSAQPAAKK